MVRAETKEMNRVGRHPGKRRLREAAFVDSKGLARCADRDVIGKLVGEEFLSARGQIGLVSCNLDRDG